MTCVVLRQRQRYEFHFKNYAFNRFYLYSRVCVSCLFHRSSADNFIPCETETKCFSSQSVAIRLEEINRERRRITSREIRQFRRDIYLIWKINILLEYINWMEKIWCTQFLVTFDFVPFRLRKLVFDESWRSEQSKAEKENDNRTSCGSGCSSPRLADLSNLPLRSLVSYLSIGCIIVKTASSLLYKCL